jgi:hypothetical protein
MYACEKSAPSHELTYFQLFNFSHLHLFHENVICKKWPKESPRVFFLFFGTPALNKPKYANT